MEYGTPEIRALVGETFVTVAASAVVTLDRSAPVGLAELALDLDVPGLVRPEAGASVVLWLGYRGATLWPVFRGTVRETQPGRLLTLSCHDALRDLSDVRLRRAWRNVTLQEAARLMLAEAGVTAFTLGVDRTPTRRLVVAANEPALDVLLRLRQSWAVDWDLYARPDGRVVFAPWAETAEALAEPVLDLVYGQNLLELTPRPEGTGTAESLLVPWVRAGHRITITDSRLWRASVTARVERAVHSVTAQSGGRTRLEWTALAN